jgi:hypothetical protein
MNWRRLWLWLVLLVAAVLLLWLDRLERQTAARSRPAASPTAPAAKPAEPIDLTRHDGQAIDFSSGRPVVKDTPADRAAVARAVKEMDEAAKDVTFQPTKPTVAEQPPAAPPKK